MEIKVVIVEDVHDIRNGLQLIINHSEGFKCIGTASSGSEALQIIPQLNPDVVLMDISMPGGMSGIEVIKLLKPKYPHIQFVISTIYEEDEKIFESLKAGASGYLLKKTEPVKLLDAIKDVFNGGSPMSSSIARKVINVFAGETVKSPVDDLSPREQEILSLLTKGMQYKSIAAQLFLSTETVRTHVRNIYEKLQVHSKKEASKLMRGR
jgi:DNA-binding NarL/FixJ family response regulator